MSYKTALNPVVLIIVSVALMLGCGTARTQTHRSDMPSDQHDEVTRVQEHEAEELETEDTCSCASRRRSRGVPILKNVPLLGYLFTYPPDWFPPDADDECCEATECSGKESGVHEDGP